MYGKWLYKEIGTEYGACMVEIYRKNYTGESIEIGALAANSLSIALENLGSITDPIGKSVCSFSIIDTDQVEYDDFFTPDATALKVVVSTRVGSGAYVTRWSGYVTPDFFAENLSYRTPISISARDNIGYLNDVDFDLTATTITVRELIQSAFKRIAEGYPMSLSFVTQKQTAEGILAIDATISTTLLREMSWGEALETILHDLGLQMRWVDNNTIAVHDLSQIPEYYAAQGFNFVDASGYREIVPAWRELGQEQDFGLKENFFEGWLREDNITFVKSVVMRPPNATNWTTDIAYYVPNNWGVARDIYTTDPSYYGSKFGKKIFFTGVSEQNPTTTYFSWRQQIQSSIVPMKMSFKAFNSVLYPSEKYASLTTPSGRRLVAYNPKDAFHGQKVGEYLQIGLKANVLLHSGLKTYILKSEWVEISDDGAGWQLDFTLPKVELSYVEGNQATAVEPREEEITINIATIPYDGELEFRIYGWYIVGKHNYWEDDYSVTNYTFDWLKCLAYINEPTFSFNTDEADSGRETNVMIAEAHNIKQEETYTFGQTFSNGGGLNAYAGALVGTDGNELIGFQRNADATNYNLLELVGRELIHFNKKNYNRLSGTIKNLNKEPLMFNRLFVREGKKYAPYNYSLNVISNEMNITSMQEVEPYETATFNTIDSQITTGGGTVSGGNNTILQYSEEAGNEKRLYELQTATEQEKNDAFVLIDKAGFSEARKLHISDIAGLDRKALEQYLVEYKYLQEADLTPIIEDFEKLEEAVNPLFGYFDANGNANNALKLGGHSADYFATAGALNIHIKDFNTYKTTTDKRLGDLEALWYMDDEGNVHTTHNIIVEGGGAFGKGSGGGGDVPSGGGIDEAQLWNILGQSGTQTIHSSHIPDLSGKYLSTSGGVITGEGYDILTINRTDNRPTLAFAYNGTTVGYLGMTTGGVPMYVNSVGDAYSLYHSGNFNPADYLPKSGGTMTGTIILPNNNFIDSQDGATMLGIDVAKGCLVGVTQHPLLLRSNGTTTINGNTLIHSGNYSSYALPLSGGIITGPLNISSNNDDKIILNNTDAETNFQFISFRQNGVQYGSLGTSFDGILEWNGNDIIHSGNIGLQTTLKAYYIQVPYTYEGGNYISDATTAEAIIPDSLAFPAMMQNTAWCGGWSTTFTLTGYKQYGGSQLSIEYNASTPRAALRNYNQSISGWTDWVEFITSANIASQSVTYATNATRLYASDEPYRYGDSNPYYLKMRYNVLGDNSWYLSVYPESPANVSVDRARKLVTSRGIFGNSFDGTADIPVTAVGHMRYLLFKDAAGTTNVGYIGRGGSTNAMELQTYGNYSLLLGAYSKNILTLAPSGAVIIGSTTDYSQKLQINGNIRFIADADCEIGNAYSLTDTNAYNRIIIGNGSTGLKYCSGRWTSSNVISHSFCVGLHDTPAVTINNIGYLGVNIGNAAYHLDVAGNVRTHSIGIANEDGTGRGISLYRSPDYVDMYGIHFSVTSKFGTHGSVTGNWATYFTTSENSYGWIFRNSSVSNVASISGAGNLTCNGGGAFGSDIRYKDIISDRQLDLETIAKAPLFTFKWTDREDKVEHLGTSAQYWLGTQFKDAVNTTNKDFYHLDYGALGVGIGISVAREVKGVKTEVQTLKEELSQVKKELKYYKELWQHSGHILHQHS